MSNENTNLFIETETSEGYTIVWRQCPDHAVDASFAEALHALATLPQKTRLELWSKAHAECGAGSGPLAYRTADGPVMLHPLLAMLSRPHA